ncbi:tetratricopeptide repeat protein [Dictyobacter arantiisoli]|uniref:Uncharacterized protein n=1 Tax=Dictyobacter arantiisoli TaxID=2014874 RepID=A0A5A5TD32_9CHLR|nr:tetratricopeptide repeat protein [Dictyobacter arantiisoli]GCF09076.1 hypothetical protein KDI_26400 [Dictyobacter arantiisoli]
MNSPALSNDMSELYSSIFTWKHMPEQNDVIDPDIPETALYAYEQAISLTPRQAVLYYHKGQVLEQLGRKTEAQTAYAEARNLGHCC